MKYFCLLVPQTDVAKLRFAFFSMNKDKRYMPTGTFYSYWASRKKPKRGGTSGHAFLKNPGVMKNIFFKKKSSVSRIVTLSFKILDKRKLHL